MEFTPYVRRTASTWLRYPNIPLRCNPAGQSRDVIGAVRAVGHAEQTNVLVTTWTTGNWQAHEDPSTVLTIGSAGNQVPLGLGPVNSNERIDSSGGYAVVAYVVREPGSNLKAGAYLNAYTP